MSPVKTIFIFFVIKNPKILNNITILDIAFSFCSIDINGIGQMSVISSLFKSIYGSFIQNGVDDRRLSIAGVKSASA